MTTRIYVKRLFAPFSSSRVNGAKLVQSDKSACVRSFKLIHSEYFENTDWKSETLCH